MLDPLSAPLEDLLAAEAEAAAPRTRSRPDEPELPPISGFTVGAPDLGGGLRPVDDVEWRPPSRALNGYAGRDSRRPAGPPAPGRPDPVVPPAPGARPADAPADPSVRPSGLIDPTAALRPSDLIDPAALPAPGPRPTDPAALPGTRPADPAAPGPSALPAPGGQPRTSGPAQPTALPGALPAPGTRPSGLVDPASGLAGPAIVRPVDPATGRPSGLAGPATSRPVDPVTGRPTGPVTGRPAGPGSGGAGGLPAPARAAEQGVLPPPVARSGPGLADRVDARPRVVPARRTLDDDATQVVGRPIPAAEMIDRAAAPTRPPAISHPPRAVVRRRRARRRLLEWPFLIVFALLSAYLIRAYVVQTFYIPSGSMHETLLEGDRVLVNKVSYHLHDVHRGDVIVFRRPPDFPVEDDDLIKRVVALPGETVEGRDRTVFVNGQPLDEPYVEPLCRGTDDFDPVTVPAGSLWVMGDNRCNSSDSRAFGTIDDDLLVGRAFVLAWPVGRLSWL